MTLPLPGSPDDDPGRQQKFDALALAMPGFGGRSVEIRSGNGTVSWPGGSITSTALTVTHGLGRTPSTVVATLTSSAGLAWAVVAAYSYTTTTFTMQMQTIDGSLPASTVTYTASWIAIG